MNTGIHTVTAADYHNDQIAARPSLTASTIKTLVNQSPLHAWGQHPKLNPGFVRDSEDRYDLGTVVHSLVLEGLSALEVVHAHDWRTKDAKEAREEARANGRIALLATQWDEVQAMAAAIREQLATHEAQPALFQDGKPEQTIVWEEDGVLCRARLDWLHDDHLTIDDLKSTKASADPRAWQRTMVGMGAEIQARFYQRGLKAITGREPAFRFCVAECAAPYAISVVDVAPALAALADAKIDYALRVWKRCLSTGEFPGYTRKVASVDAAGWMETQWLEREAEEELAA